MNGLAAAATLPKPEGSREEVAGAASVLGAASVAGEASLAGEAEARPHLAKPAPDAVPEPDPPDSPDPVPDDPHPVPDPTTPWVPLASPEVAGVWAKVTEAVGVDPPPMGLSEGDRPAADVEVLAGSFASCEYLLAARMHAARRAGSLPLTGRGGVLAARGWSIALARRLARCGELADEFPTLAAAWAAGVITSEHVDPIARSATRFTAGEMAAVIEQLAVHWGALSPAAVERFIDAALNVLHPPGEPGAGEESAYESRGLSFAVLGDTVHVVGSLPRLEGELVMAALDALAERLRAAGDRIPVRARRADALVQLVNDAHACAVLPTRGGLPVSLTVTLERSAAGDTLQTTSLGHFLTPAESRWASCDAAVTSVLIDRTRATAGPAGHVRSPGTVGSVLPVGSAGGVSTSAARTSQAPTPAARIAALAVVLLTSARPISVGRTQRTATPAQRRALAVRDRDCLIPGCDVPAEACQVHHVHEWAEGGPSDLDNLVSLCWTHHRQVDLGMWTIAHVPGPGSSPSDARDPRAWPVPRGAQFAVTRTPRWSWRL